jgi:uncharacterized protein (TIGR03435 family)
MGADGGEGWTEAKKVRRRCAKAGTRIPRISRGIPPWYRHGPPRNVRQTFRDFSMADFCQQLAWTLSPEGQSGWLGYISLARMVDKTGLAGTCDFTLEFAGRFQSGAYPSPLPNGESDTAPYLFDALRQQLGLQLDEKKSRLDVLVVDHVDRVPTEN